MNNDTKRARLEAVNELIEVIASNGREFFRDHTSQTVGHFKIKLNGHLYWFDEWSHKDIYMSGSDWFHMQKCHHGGTLRGLLMYLAGYIRTGIHDQGWRLAGDYWGYDNRAMKPVEDAAARLLQTEATT